MKPTQIASLLLAAAGAASAQNYTTSPGFTLSLIDAHNATLNGYQISSCHAGAAIEALCIGPPASPATYSSTYYLNTTEYNSVADQPTGPLVWNLPFTGENGPSLASEGLTFQYSVNSNVATPLFYPSEPNVYVGFDVHNKLFAVGDVDDNTFTSARPNATSPSFAVYHWEACYIYTGGYYYFSLAWVTSGRPSNPTCCPTNVTRTFV